MNPNGYIPSLTPFSSTYQPKNRGARKPNTLKKYVSGNGRLSRDDQKALAVYLLSCPREKLQDIVKDSKQPMAIVAFASAMLGDITAKKTTTVELLMRIIGDSSGSSRGDASELPDNTEGGGSESGEQFARYEYPELKNVTEGVDGDGKEG